MRAGAVIVAGGKGLRMGGGEEKLLLPLGGIPILARTLIPFQECPEIAEIVLAANAEIARRFQADILKPGKISKAVRIAPGGQRRQDSVYNGLRALSDAVEIVLIHDGDRPFVTGKLIRAVLAASAAGGALAAVRAKDTVKLQGEGMAVEKTLLRKRLWLAQTPQGFPLKDILAGHERARAEGWNVTDDAEIVERCGGRVTIVESDYDNIKVATPEDYDLACLIQSRLPRSSG
jgi:2-C-methyl-D-erythritol 4-phosphate cytidylyltransferase